MLNDIINVLGSLPYIHVKDTILTVSIVIILLLLRSRALKRNHRNLDLILGFFPLFIELIFQIQSLIHQEWQLSRTLPMEISYITSIMLPISLYRPSRKLQSWIFYIGIWSATAAFLNTILSDSESWYLRLRYYGHHGILLYFGISIYIGGYRSKLKDYFNTVTMMIATILIMGIFNTFIGSNYMFTNYKPPGMNFSTLMPGWPYYYIIIVGVGLVFCAILYFLSKENLHKPVK